MTTPRFYVSSDALRSGGLCIEGEDHHHASRVLRMKKGDMVLLMDGKGCVGHGKVSAIDAACMRVEVAYISDVPQERPRLHLFQGLPHGSKMDDVVHWGVELGAASLVPFLSSRTGSVDAPQTRRLVRWRRIAREAARVAGRAYIPEIEAVNAWPQAMEGLRRMDMALFADEKGGCRPAEALVNANPLDLGLVVGPEGGFSAAEREELLALGAHPVTLGASVMRTETAGMVLLAAVRCRYGLL
ncbi:MAG: RsmE family RNA methyltransferase [Actinomycetota bacterium]